MSSNIHGDTFSKNFLTLKKMTKISKLDVWGFWAERFAMVLIAQHGINKKTIKNLLKDFNKWKKCNQ